jgi:endonuclease-3
LNEARVSQVSELERAFPGRADSEWRGFRLRAVLQFVFEKSFTFEFESLKKKTLDLAVKQMARLKHATPFIRNYTLQSAVGAHILPIDDSMKRLLVWLGVVDPGQSEDDISESLKSSVRKADAATFCIAVRMAATDERVQSGLPELTEAPPEGYDPTDAIERLQALYTRGDSRGKAKSKPAGKPAAAVKKTAPAKKEESKAAAVNRKKSAKPASRTK